MSNRQLIGGIMSASDILSHLVSIKKFVQKYPTFTNGGIRQLIFYEQIHGLKRRGVVVKVGRRVLIDEEAFLAWIRLSNQLK